MTIGDLTGEMVWLMFMCFVCGVVWTLAFQAMYEYHFGDGP